MMKNFRKMFTLVAVIISLSLAGCKGKESPAGPPSNPLSLEFGAASMSLLPGEKTYVDWKVTKGGVTKEDAECTAYGSWNGSKGAKGAQQVGPGTYELVCTCNMERVSHTLTITEKAPPQKCEYTALKNDLTFPSCEATGEVRFPVLVIGTDCPPPTIVADPGYEATWCQDCKEVKLKPVVRNPDTDKLVRAKIEGCELRATHPGCPVVPQCVLEVETSKNFSCDSQTSTYEFDTNGPWSLTDVTGLITITGPTSGNGIGDEKVTITLSSNKASDAVFRTAGTFKINGCNGSKVVTIGQYACPTQPPPQQQTCNDPDARNYKQTGKCAYDPPTVNLDANPSTVVQGGNSILSWNYSNAHNGCTMSGDWSGTKPGPSGSGNQSTGALSTVKVYSYTLTCSGKGGSRSDSATVTVTTPPQQQCKMLIQNSQQPFTYQGGPGTFSVSTTPTTCHWTSKSNTQGVDITSGFSGTGGGTVTYMVSGIPPGQSRPASISVTLTETGEVQKVPIDQH
jgi:hypothetical protein